MPVSKWVARATRPFRSATRRPDHNDEPIESRPYLLRATALAVPHVGSPQKRQCDLLTLPKFVSVLFWSCSTLLKRDSFVTCSGRCGFQSCRTPFASSCCSTLLATQCRFLTRVFHALGPRNNSRPVTHLNHGVRRNQVEIEHLVAGRAEQDKIAHVVVVVLTIKVSDFQNVGDSESAMRAD